MLMDAAGGAVFVAGAENPVVDASLVDFAVHPFGVARGKLHAGEQIEDDRVIHFNFLDWREPRDKRDVTDAIFVAFFVNDTAG